MHQLLWHEALVNDVLLIVLSLEPLVQRKKNCQEVRQIMVSGTGHKILLNADDLLLFLITILLLQIFLISLGTWY